MLALLLAVVRPQNVGMTIDDVSDDSAVKFSHKVQLFNPILFAQHVNHIVLETTSNLRSRDSFGIRKCRSCDFLNHAVVSWFFRPHDYPVYGVFTSYGSGNA